MTKVTNELIREHKIGRFSLCRKIMSDAASEHILSLFGKMIIVRAEGDFYRDAIDYIAYSPLFPSIPEGTEIPKYHIHVYVHEDGEHVYSVEDRTGAWNEGRVSISYAEPEELPMPGGYDIEESWQ